MRYVASVHAYDVMDTQHVHLRVVSYPDDATEQPHSVLVCTTTVPGTGENDPRLWAQDALVALIEVL